jgi:hypothetical protein
MMTGQEETEEDGGRDWLLVSREYKRELDLHLPV